VSGTELNRHPLAHLWKTRTEDAKARLDRAAESVEELSKNLETIHQADANARNNAIRVYLDALEEYTNISKVYQDLVLHGTVPDEAQRRNSRLHTSPRTLRVEPRLTERLRQCENAGVHCAQIGLGVQSRTDLQVGHLVPVLGTDPLGHAWRR